MTESKIRKILLWIFIGLLSLGQFQRVELIGSFKNINIYFHDIFILFWLADFIIRYVFKNKTLSCFTNFIGFTKSFIEKLFTSFKQKQKRLEIIFIIILLLGILINFIKYHDFVSILYTLRLFGYILFAFSLHHLIKIKKIKANVLRFQFFGAGAIILFLGLLQITFIQNTSLLAVLGWDNHFHRLVSTIFDPGFTGIILAITYFYFLTLTKVFTNKLANTFITLSFLLGIALTFSRATYLAFVIGLLLLLFKKILKQQKLFSLKNLSKNYLATIAIFIVMVLMIPKPGGEGVNLLRTSTIIARKNSAEIQTEVLISQLQKFDLQAFAVGNGLFSQKNSLHFMYDQKSEIDKLNSTQELIPSHSRIPDNLFINLMLSTGVIGTIVSIFLLFKWIIIIYKTDPIIAATILIAIIHSQFSNSLLQPFVLIILLGGIVSIKPRA